MIKTKREYRRALRHLDRLMKMDSLVEAELSPLADRIVEYEEEHFPLDKPSEEDMETFMREQQEGQEETAASMPLPNMPEFMQELLAKVGKDKP